MFNIKINFKKRPCKFNHMKIRYRTIIGLVFLLFVSSAFAQKHYGIRLGYQSSVMMKDSKKYGGHLDAYYASFYRDTKVFPFLFMNTGLDYMRMGAEIDNMDYTIDYLGVPLGLKCKIGPLYALGGAAINFKISEKDNPFEDKAKWYDAKTFAGGGINILFFTLEAKYIWGLTHIHDGITNDGFQLGCGMRF